MGLSKITSVEKKGLEDHESEERLFALASDAVLIIEWRKKNVRLIATWTDGISTDSWYATIGDARQQAINRWGPNISAWRVVPAEVSDVVTFARERAS